MLYKTPNGFALLFTKLSGSRYQVYHMHVVLCKKLLYAVIYENYRATYVFPFVAEPKKLQIVSLLLEARLFQFFTSQSLLHFKKANFSVDL